MTNKDRVRRAAFAAGRRPISAAARRDLAAALDEVEEALSSATPEQRRVIVADLVALDDDLQRRHRHP